MHSKNHSTLSNVRRLYTLLALTLVQFCSVAQSCLTLCNPMGCSTAGLPVHHQLLGFTQTHVHWVGDAIQPSHPLLSPSPPTFNLSQHQGLFFKIYFYFILLYNTVLVLPYIDMNQPWVYMSSQSWTPLPPSTPYHLSGSSPCTSPSILYPASNIDWRLISYLIIYMFQCHSPKSSHPLPLPQSLKVHSIHLCLLLSRIQGYHYHLSKFHIYVLVYGIGVFLSGLLHSV